MQNDELLFPRAKEIRNVEEKKLYVESRMVQMINDGAFYLTRVMLQPEYHLAGEIIFGQAMDADKKTFTVSWNTDETIKGHRVKLESIKCKTRNPDMSWSFEKNPEGKIQYKNGTKRVSSLSLYGGRGGGVDGASGREVRADNIINAGGPVVDVSINAAWQILNQWGLYIAGDYKTVDAQRRNWTVREIPPTETQHQDKKR